jgi:TRAP-type C4-dicarboxylate transport system permease large subunit
LTYCHYGGARQKRSSFGVGYYAACAIGRVEPVAGMRPIWGYMLALVIGTIIVAAVPWISIGFLQ